MHKIGTHRDNTMEEALKAVKVLSLCNKFVCEEKRNIMEQTVYIKLDKSVCIDSADVFVSDIAGVYCADRHICNRVKAIKILKSDTGSDRRYVVSVIKVIECILKENHGLTVESIGEQDVVIEHKDTKGKKKAAEFMKVLFICLITLLGGGFAVMAYNNDVGMADMFSRIYELVYGDENAGGMILEISYSIGLAVGIIVFYGHFGSWKFGKDPTPLEVEMRLYEDDVDTAMIKQSSREGNEIDVD